MKRPNISNSLLGILLLGTALSALSYAYKFYDIIGQQNKSDVVIHKLSTTVLKTHESVRQLSDTVIKYKDRISKITKHDTTTIKEIDTSVIALRVSAAEKQAEKRSQDTIQLYKQKYLTALIESKELKTDNDRLKKTPANVNLQATYAGEKNAVRVFPQVPGQTINNAPFLDIDQGNQLLLQLRSSYNLSNNTFQLGFGPELKINRISINGGVLYNPAQLFEPVLKSPFSFYLGTRLDIFRYRFK